MTWVKDTRNKNQEQEMGVDCCAEAEVTVTAPAPVQETLKDLPEVKWQGISDVFAKMEASLPFNRINVNDMMAKIDAAEDFEKEKNKGPEAAAPGDKEGPADDEEGPGYVTLWSLRKALPTSAWLPLTQPQSPICQVLLSAPFKNDKKGQTEE